MESARAEKIQKSQDADLSTQPAAEPKSVGDDQSGIDTARNEEERNREERVQRAETMSKMLDVYVANRTPSLVEEALKGMPETEVAVREARAQEVKEQSERIKQFFVSVDAGKREETPLTRMAQIYEYLDAPENPSEQAEFETAMSAHMQELVERAFDQHLDNPEQYVSHGFDHSLNVADYAKNIIDLNDVIVDQTAQKYGISAKEAKFMLENVALFHDCGYPHVGAKAKAVHGIAGADLISTPKMQGIFRNLIRTPEANLDLLSHDLRDSILFHSADKVENQFSAKIRTTRGTFLSEGRDVYTVISTFNDPSENPVGVARDILEIEVADEETKLDIEAQLALAAADTARKTGLPPESIPVTVGGSRFKGRYTDLARAKDNRLGLEYSEIDALQTPLHAIIRLADNMDMRRNRFSAVQREPAFRATYQAFSDGGQTSRALVTLEAESKLFKGRLASAGSETEKAQLLADSPQLVQSQFQALLAENQNLVTVTTEEIASLQQPSDAEKLWRKGIAERIINSEDQVLSPENKRKIMSMALAQDSQGMRHFGGCEAVTDVRMERFGERGAEVSIVVVTADRGQFEQLNRTRVQDSSLDKEGNVSTVELGIGEYQIWRAREAYKSISVGGKKIGIRVQDENGLELQTTFEQFREEK
ncbi:MAG: hypothetical protein G01um10148_547 [Parcubacteria group bacterium Gr01-1014_8]|nr:MAG: hypothetical protein G01um10148_547 [Parcubacteria group bacterium Gr01-1014_8]